jgi:hypothetical protein
MSLSPPLFRQSMEIPGEKLPSKSAPENDGAFVSYEQENNLYARRVCASHASQTFSGLRSLL